MKLSVLLQSCNFWNKEIIIFNDNTIYTTIVFDTNILKVVGMGLHI